MAAVCRVAPTTLAEWARSGLLPAMRPGGTGNRRYRRADLPWLPAAGDPQLLAPADVAALSRVTRCTVNRWQKSGRLPHIVLPSGLPRFSRPVVTAFLESR